MATVVNDRDVFLQSQTERLTKVITNYVLLSSSATVFKVGATATLPSQIVLSAVPMGVLAGTPTFSITSGTGTLNVTGNSCTVLPANMTTDSITVQASLDFLGNTYTSAVVITKISDISVLTLDKATYLVNCNQDGSSPVLTGAISTATVKVGGVDDSTNWNYLWSNEGGSGSTTGSTTRTVTVTAMTSDTLLLRCTASKSGYTSQTSDFLLTKNKQADLTKTIFIRSITTPATPAPSSGTPGSWSDTVPAGSDTVWSSYGTKTALATNYTWGLPITAQGAPGPAAITGDLTNQAHVVSSLEDGTGYSLTNAGGTFKMYSGTTDVTTSSTFAITGGTDNGTNWTKTQNGLVLTIQETTGVYSLSGTWVTTDTESFTITGTYAGVTSTKIYTISRARVGISGAYAFIDTPASVFTKNSKDSATSGTYTPTSMLVKGKLHKDNSLTDWGWVTTTPNGGAESARTASSTGITITPAATGVTDITVKLYDAASGGSLMDTEVIPIVFKGADGSNGTDATIKYLQLSSYAIAKAQAGTYNPTTVTMYSYSKAGTAAATLYTGTFKVYLNGSGTASTTQSSVSSYTYTIPGGTTSVVIKLFETDGVTEIDSQSVAIVVDGPTGSNGAPGLSAILTNDSHSVPCNEAGAPNDYSGSGTSMYVYSGTGRLTYVTSGASTGQYTVSAAGSGIGAGSASGNGTNAYSIGIANSMTTNPATITYTISGYDNLGNSFTLTKVQTFSKSIKGATGTGTTGATGPRSSTGYLYYNSSSASAPAVSPAPSGYNFTTGAFSTLPTGWLTTFTAGTPAQGDKYWALNYSVSEATYGGSQTVTTSAPFNWTNFTGLVTFTNHATAFNTDITSISGGKINTGNITVASGALGYICSTGKTSYSSDATAGFFLGFDAGVPKLNIGDATSNLKWDGANLILKGNVDTSGYIYASGKGTYNVTLGDATTADPTIYASITSSSSTNRLVSLLGVVSADSSIASNSVGVYGYAYGTIGSSLKGRVAIKAYAKGSGSPGHITGIECDSYPDNSTFAGLTRGASITASAVNNTYHTGNVYGIHLGAFGNSTGTCTGIYVSQSGGATNNLTCGVYITGATTSIFSTGNIVSQGNITAYQTSDKNLKENIRNIGNAVCKLNLINGVHFDWIDEYLDKQGVRDDYFNRKQDIGLIAQEVQEVLPEAVAKRQDGTLAVRYEKLIPLLIEAIKELDRRTK